MKLLNPKIDLEEFFKKTGIKSLLIIDYDGTIAPFVKERMKAFPYEGIQEILLDLTKKKDTRVVIVSGRSLADLEILLDKPGLELWGSHGLERKLPSGVIIFAPIDKKIFQGLLEARAIVEKKIEEGKIKKESLETKPYSIAIHWRGVDEEQKAEIKHLEPQLQRICSNYKLEVHHFDGGIELRSSERNKADAVRQLMSEESPDTAIAYLGDDATDEEAFAALGSRGLKVFVHTLFRPVYADLFLNPPEELVAFLDRWRKS